MIFLRCLLLAVLSLALPLRAQNSTANIIGTVQDSTNARISGASVKLVNVLTGTENSSATSSDGAFVLPGVIPGAYTLQIQCEGFATSQFTGIVLNAGDTKNFLIRMRVGPISQTVVIDESGITLNTSDASVGTVVNRKFVGNVPLNGRSFQDLISLTPGFISQSPQAAGLYSGSPGDFSVNGQKTQANSVTVDGVSGDIGPGVLTGRQKLTSIGSMAGLTAIGTTQSLASIDALQEFRILTSTYSAEHGRSPGGQLSFLTRSGTSTIHGSLYDYFRNSIADPVDWFSGDFSGNFYSHSHWAYRQNDFGATLGMPLALPSKSSRPDQTFLFFSYEGLHLAQPTPPSFQYVPSYEIRLTAPIDLQNVLANFSDTVQKESTDAFGNPTGLAFMDISGHSLPGQVNAWSIRLDHNFSPKISAFVRYGITPSSSQAQQLSSLTTSQINTQIITIGVGTQLSNTMSNEFRIGYSLSDSNLNTLVNLDRSYAHTTGLNSALGLPASVASARGEAFIRVSGAGASAVNTDVASSSLSQWNVRDSFTFQRAKHLIRLGIDQRRFVSSVNRPALSVEADFYDRQSMEQNLASDIVATKSLPAAPVFEEFSAFAQDEWRLAPALTLSLGLRWEVNPPPTGEHGDDAYTLLGDINSPETLKLANRGTPLWHTSWTNLAPRIGAAWMARNSPGKELIVRAGGGVFFDTGNEPVAEAFNGLGFTASSLRTDVPVPIDPSQFDFTVAPVAPYVHTRVYAFPSSLRPPYTLQWNAGLDKALGRNQSLTISYVGSQALRLLQEQRKDVRLQNPDFGYVYYFPSGITSSYQALQVQFQRSVSPGVQALANYVWAHTLDYGSTAAAFPLVYGNSDLDVRHNLQGGLSWDEPQPRGEGFLRQGLGAGWGADGRLIARTSFPVTIFGNQFSDPETGLRYYSGANFISNRPLYIYGSQYPGGRMINGGEYVSSPAFVLPENLAPGDSPRNITRGFNAVQVNLSVRKNFHLSERFNLQFRAEAFNVLNHPNFGYIDPYVTDATFGQTTHLLNQSFGTTTSLYQQGGPRSIQISLKVVF